MCPLCIANAVVLAAGATSGGGVTAVVVSKFLGRKRKQQTKDEQNETSRTGIRSRSGAAAGVGGCASTAFGQGEGVDEGPRRAGRRAPADAVGRRGEGVRVRWGEGQGELARSVRRSSSVDCLPRVL